MSQSRTEAVTTPKQEWATVIGEGQELSPGTELPTNMHTQAYTCQPKVPPNFGEIAVPPNFPTPQEEVRELLSAFRRLQAKVKKRRKRRRWDVQLTPNH
jgi:hypothetical protein